MVQVVELHNSSKLWALNLDTSLDEASTPSGAVRCRMTAEGMDTSFPAPSEGCVHLPQEENRLGINTRVLLLAER